jgi:hypothetical protein
MFSGIEATMKKESIQTCVLALSVYTEIVGGFVTGKLREKGGWVRLAFDGQTNSNS